MLISAHTIRLHIDRGDAGFPDRLIDNYETIEADCRNGGVDV